MKLKKSVKLMEKLLHYPDYIRNIQLTKADYNKVKKKIAMNKTLVNGIQYETFAGYPVECIPELEESRFILTMHDGWIVNDNAPPVRSCRNVFAKADLSYMEGLKME